MFREGERVRDPLPLGLQWMIDLEKERFSGSAAIKERRAAGLKQKIIGLAADVGCTTLKTGAPIFHEDQAVGEVVADCFSYVLNQPLALGLLPLELAFSGLAFRVGSPEGAVVRSISMPPIMPKSLTVKLDEM
jgi:glycine cleavage system aminomethyltransferase T